MRLHSRLRAPPLVNLGNILSSSSARFPSFSCHPPSVVRWGDKSTLYTYVRPVMTYVCKSVLVRALIIGGTLGNEVLHTVFFNPWRELGFWLKPHFSFSSHMMSVTSSAREPRLMDVQTDGHYGYVRKPSTTCMDVSVSSCTLDRTLFCRNDFVRAGKFNRVPATIHNIYDRANVLRTPAL